MLRSPDLMDHIRTTSSHRHDTISVTYKWLRWHVGINGHTVAKMWRRSEALVLGNFLARLAPSATLVASTGPGQPHGERREFTGP